MKKVLFTTTALVFTAGVASAEVGVSGFAELGFFDDDTEFQFHTDIDATLTMSGATDNGLAFGASIDIDETDGSGSCDDDAVAAADGSCDVTGNSLAFDADTQGGESIFVSGGFGTVTMGDTDGGLDWAMQEALIGGSIQDNQEHGGYNGNSFFDGAGDGQILRYDYSLGDFAFAVSLEQIENGAGLDGPGDYVYGVGFRYGLDVGGGVRLNFGAGYQGCDNCEAYGISVDARFDNGLRAILNWSTADTDTDADGSETDHIGLAVGYQVDALVIAANYGQFDADGVETEGYGAVINYDLGGGAEAQFGVGNTDADGADSVTTYSLGLALSF